MDTIKLREFANDFLKEHFGLELEIPIKVNTRLSSTLGCFRIMRRHGSLTPVRIDMNAHLMENASPDMILDVLKHELIHYALFKLGKPYGDNDKHFRETCKSLNVVLTHSINIIQPVHIYTCGCREFKRTRRLNKNRGYYCGTCGKELVYLRCEKTERGFEYDGK